MKINVKHVAQLANLPISPDEEEKFAQQIVEILGYFEKFNALDTKNVETTSQVTGLENVTREDVAKPSLTQEEALQNAKSTHNEFIKVKAILSE